MTLAEILVKCRKLRNLSVRAAASEIGISFTYLSSLENGRLTHPKMIFIHRIAQFYELDEDALCVRAERIPSDVFWRIVQNPLLINIIRNYPV